jgi:hypothetical protein
MPLATSLSTAALTCCPKSTSSVAWTCGRHGRHPSGSVSTSPLPPARLGSRGSVLVPSCSFLAWYALGALGAPVGGAQRAASTGRMQQTDSAARSTLPAQAACSRTDGLQPAARLILRTSFRASCTASPRSDCLASAILSATACAAVQVFAASFQSARLCGAWGQAPGPPGHPRKEAGRRVRRGRTCEESSETLASRACTLASTSPCRWES